MIIDNEKLTNNSLGSQDKDKIKIYHYDRDSLTWVLEGGIRNGDTVSTEVNKLGTYALGIELSDNNDSTPPEIYDFGPNEGSTQNDYPEICEN